MISDVDLLDWLDTEYTSPIPKEVIDEVATYCGIDNYNYDVQKFANVIGLLTLKFKPDVAKTSIESLNWNMLPEFSLMPEFPSLYAESKG